MLKYQIVPVTPYAQNCSIVWCDQTMIGAVIDPGGNVERISTAVQALGVRVEQILITHGHLDHAAGAAALAKELSVPINGPQEEDLFWLEMLSNEVRAAPGFEDAQSFVPTRWLNDEDTVTVGEETLLIKHCPGHTPGHIIFYSKSAKLAFVGDVLFAGSIGRTDFPRGDFDQLMNSIKTKLWPLGNETLFVPGHGPESTFGRERQTNPYVKGL